MTRRERDPGNRAQLRFRPWLAAIATVAAASLTIPASALAAPIPVTTTDDVVNPVDGQCSLREAVTSANQNDANPTDCPNGDSGELDSILLAGGGATYTLTGAANENDNASGDLDLLAGGGPVSITGAGPSQTIIDADGVDRVLHLPNAILTVSGVKLENGSVSDRGGGIQGSGSVTLTNVELFNNEAAAFGGGGIEVTGPASSLVVTDSEIHGNATAGNGGGGGILTGDGSLEVTGSSIHDNHAGQATTQGFGGGGGIRAAGPTTITSSSIEDNSTGDGDPTTSFNGDYGGGIRFSSTEPIMLTITGSRIVGNAVERFGGGLYMAGADTEVEISASTFEGNQVTTTASGEQARGGAIYNTNQADLQVSGSLFDSNSVSPHDNGTGAGGAISTDAIASTTTTVLDSRFEGNFVNVQNGATGRGGAIAAEGSSVQTRVEGTTLAGNSVAGFQATARGGALGLRNGELTVVNSTIAGNSTSSLLGGLAEGGGIQFEVTDINSTVDLVASTVSGNSAASGSGLHMSAFGPAFTIKGTIIDQGMSGCFAPNGQAAFTSANGYNVDAGSGCIGGFSNLSGTDPMLAPLADNGGPHAGAAADDLPIPTMALAATSPAVDHNQGCTDEQANPLTSDQRGFARPFGAHCDTGPFEYTDSDGDGIEDGVDPTPFGDPPSSGGSGGALAPSNQFAFGKLKRKPRKGIAFLFVNLPGPGEIGLAGKGIQRIGGAGIARASRTVSGGRVKLRIRAAKGKQGRKLRQRLRDRGKAKLRVRVSYQPPGAAANTRVRKLKLVRK